MYDHGGMNRACRLIWNRAKGRWVVAPETARGGGWAVGAVVLAGLVASTGTACADPAATALPTGGQVVAGSVSIAADGAAMTVTQGTSRGIVNWQSFDVGSSASVNFKQPDASSVTLNRVKGGTGSVIAGRMSANGRVYVVNPNGVLFTKTAQVNVGGLVASTADIADGDFMSGKDVFTNDGATGSVINQGTINARDGGAVVLIGGTVSNQGTINARNGNAVLAAGAKVTLDAGAEGHLKIEVDGATTAALVENGGLISASGGQVVMTAQGAGEAVSSVVSNTGTIEAQTIGARSGKVTLLAGMKGGEVKVGGTIDASAPSGGDGGAVETSAAKVTVAPTAKVTTLAAKGKTGNWLIDPYDVTISTATDSGGFTAAVDDTVINVTTLTNALATTGVTVSTGAGGSQAGNITVDAPISWSANTTLTLEAAGSIAINKDVTATGSTAGLALTYGGDYSLNNGARVTLSSLSASLSLNGSAYTLIHDVTALQSISGSGLYALAEDIDASATSSWNSGVGFTPINGFSGTLAGLGHAVDSLYMNDPGSATVGLLVMTNGAFRDFTLSNITVVSGGSAGALAYRFDAGGSVINVHATGSITATADGGQVGGLVGWFDQSTMVGSSSTATVTGFGEVGGLVGRLRAGSITDSYATGAVAGTTDYVGGLVGGTYQGGTLTNVYASGKVTGTTNVGGLVGGITVAGAVTATNAYWDADSTGQSGSSDGTSITNANAYTQGTYTGFDFADTWVTLAGETRPMLRNEYSTVIYTPHALQLMSRDLTASYKLGANLAMTSAFTASGGYYGDVWGTSGFGQVGTSTGNFTGSFDGQSHTITGLTISRGGTDYIGLFGYTNGAVLSNVTLSGGGITGRYTVGALAGYMLGGSVTSASAGATVTGTSTGGAYTGGLVGTVDGGAVSLSSSSGNVTGAGSMVGGLVGYLNNSGTITTSYATGNVTGTNTDVGFGYIGGLVGANGYSGDGGTISRSYATGTVTGASGPIGGFVGHNEGSITDSYATGRVIGTGTAGNIGGFVGVNYFNGTISNAYSTGYVTGSSQVGGFAGYNNNNAASLTNLYWDSQTSGQSTGLFGGLGGSNVTAKTTAELQGSLPTGFSSAIWGTGTGRYPYFSWNHTSTPVVISGTAYSDAGATALAGATVTAITNGASLGSAVTGSNGYYYILASNGSINANGALTYLDGQATQAAAFEDTVAATGITGLDIYGSAIHLVAGRDGVDATKNAYVATMGAYGDTDLSSFLSSSTFDALTTAAGYGVYLDASSDYSLNTDLRSAGLLSLTSGGTFGVSGVVGLRAAGALTVNSPLSWNTTADLTLTTTSGGDITLGDTLTASSGSITFSAGGTATTNSGIGVNSFSLTAGTWSQIAATLPSFSATDFRLTTSATFIRAQSGDGTSATPYMIADAYGLQGMASTSLSAKSFGLANDIDASATAHWRSGGGFVPVATFSGTLNGGGHTITGLTISSAATKVGLFSDLSSATVSNLGFVGGTISGYSSVGALAGYATNSTIDGVYSSTPATAYSANAGGLIGIMEGGTLSNSYGTGAVTVTLSTGSAAGGLIGLADSATITTSHATGDVSGGDDVGGLIGRAQDSSSITDSYATGAVSGRSFVGGLTGALDNSSVSGSFATGTVTATGAYAGGLAALASNATISNTYATGAVSASAGTSCAGGLVGYANSSNVSYSYASGSVSASYAGGLVGLTNQATFTSNVWDTRTSGQATSGATSGVTGLTTAQMKEAASYTGWDVATNGGSSSVWRLYEGLAAPLLRSFLTSLSVTGGDGSKTYDGSASTTSVGTLTYSPTGYTASLVDGTATYTASSADVGTYSGATLTLGGLHSSQLGYDITFVPGTLTVGKAALTVTANDASKTYDGQAHSGGAGVGYAGFVNGETASVLGGTLVLGGTAQGAIDTGTYSLTASGLTSGNYDITFMPGTLTISPAQLTAQALSVTANDDSKTYDGLAYGGGNGVSFSGFVNGETASVLGGTLAYGGTAQGAVDAGTYTLTASGLTSSNYSITFLPGTLTINKAVLTVTANDAAKAYDGLAYGGGAGVAYSGFVNGETASVLGGTLVLGGTAQGAIDAGTYTLTASGLTARNYDITFVPGALTIGQAALTVLPLTVTANDAVKTYDGLVYSGGNGVGFSGFVNGETVAVLGGALVYGGTAQGAIDAGTYTLTASGLTSGNYTITFLPGKLTIDKAVLTVTANDHAKTYDGLAYGGGAGVGFSGFVNGETSAVLGGTLSYGGTAQGAVEVGSYTLTASGLVSSNYAIAYASGMLSVNKAAPTVAANTGGGAGTSTTVTPIPESELPTASSLSLATRIHAGERAPAVPNTNASFSPPPSALTFAPNFVSVGDGAGR